jgi:hypothetical protein
MVVRFAGTANTGTAMADDAAFTPGTSDFTPAGGTYRSVRDTVNDNDGGAFAMTQSRAILSAIEDTTGTSSMDDINHAVRVTPVTTVTVGGQSATNTTTEYTTCTNQVNIRPTTATTTQLVAGVASKLTRLCSLFVFAEGTQTVTIVEGTTTTNPCDTGQSTLLGPLGLSTTNGTGFVLGNGMGVVLDGLANANNICVTTSAAVAVTIQARYAIY